MQTHTKVKGMLCFLKQDAWFSMNQRSVTAVSTSFNATLIKKETKKMCMKHVQGNYILSTPLKDKR